MTNHSINASEQTKVFGGSRRLVSVAYSVPVLVFLVVFGLLFWGLNPDRDPTEVPSALIGKPVPDFDLPPVKGRALGLTTADLHGEVSLVNVFASWCTACRDDHPLLMSLKAEAVVPIHGLNYKDAPDDADNWLASLGDPYTRTGADRDGRVSIEWGVYGVPETFVIDSQGHIAHKQIGPITPQTLERTILPLIARLREQRGGADASNIQ